MRRWISNARSDAKRTTRYLPRRSTCSTRSPVSSAATASGSSGRVSRTSSISTCSRRRPSSAGAIAVGMAALHLGAGRRTKEDSIDHSVGVLCRAKRGASVSVGDVLAEVHGRDDASGAEAVAAVLAAYELGDEPPREHPILLDVVA